MAHLQYMPGDPRLVDQLVYELKSKGIFDQFRKECIADVDTRPAYQNLRQRVESSVSSFLSRQCWKPDLNKNQLREKLRKHILDGNYLEQGLERIVDQVVNPKVAPVFIPQVEDLVYNFLGITRKKQSAETSTEKSEKNENSLDDLLPTDLEAVSPGSVKSHDGEHDATHDPTEENKVEPMEIDQEPKEVKPKEEEATVAVEDEKEKNEQVQDAQMSDAKESINTELEEKDKQSIPLPGEIKLENIVPPQNTPPKIDLEKIELPKEVIESKPTIAIPLPEEPKGEKDIYFKPITANSDDDESSSDSSLRRNMSPLTPIRNFINENSCDAQQGFENDSDNKYEEKKEQPSTFRFAIENKSAENSSDVVKPEKKDDQTNLAYQFNNQVNINNFNTPMYDDSSNSNNLQIDYESDANSKINVENKQMETENSEDSKRERKSEDKRSSHKSSHRSRDSHRQSSNKDKRSDSKHSTSRESSRHDKKSKDDRSKSKSSHREREKSKDRNDKKDSRDSKHRSSHKSSSSSKDSKSHRSSSSSQRHSSKHDDKKSSSSHKDKNDKSSDKSSKDKKDSKSSSHRSDKDKKSSSKSKSDDKDKKKDKKDTDDHYSVSGRGNNSRRSTDRDSNDGSSSSKSSHNPPNSKASENKSKESKESSSKSDNTSTSGESTSPSDKEILLAQLENDSVNTPAVKPVRVDTHLEIPIASPPRLPFVPDLTLRKPKFAANLEEAKKFIKMRKFLDEEQKRMNQEAALLLEFQANVRPSLSQVYSSIPGPELEFACINKNHIEYQPPQREREEKTTLILENHLEPKILLENLDVDAIKDIIGVTNEVEEPIEECNASFDDKLTKVEHTVVETENIDSEHSVIKDEDNEVLGNDAMKSNEVTQNGCDLKDVNEIKNETYEENKPFSQLVDEIMQYGKASERMKMNNEKPNSESPEKVRSDLFEVTIITEELSENEEVENNQNELENGEGPKETLLHYFDEQEVIDAELQRHKFRNFLKRCPTHLASSNKMYLINCGTYEENIFKEVSGTFGNYEVVNYHRNGHLKLPNKNIVKDVNLESEITLPVDSADSDTTVSNTPVFSPVKSECSFELSSDYDAKLEEMVNKTSRQEIMEIILGSAVDESPSKAPKINYCVDPFIANDNVLKRKVNEVDSTMNNNKHVLTTTNKIRKLSGSDQITSTTEEPEEVTNNNRIPISTRSKYLGRAKRVGLPRPRKTNLPNSPSSDKSVENYEEDTTKHTPNGKIKTPQRSKFQRYDTTDLYKPKLHYLSRRNNVS